MNNLIKYYGILGLEIEATEEQVKKAYRLLVKKWHPDLYINDQEMLSRAEQKFKEISEAYQIILSVIGDEEEYYNNNQKSVDINVGKIDAETYFQLGVNAFKQDNLTEAVEFLNLAIKLNPDYLEAYFSRATALQKQGFDLRADNDWRKVSELKLKQRSKDKFTEKKYSENTQSNTFKNKYQEKEYNRRKVKEKVTNPSSPSYVPDSDWQVSKILKIHRNTVNEIIITGDKTIAITVSSDGCFCVVNLVKKVLVKSIIAHEEGINSIALSRDEELFATAGKDKIIRIWNLKKTNLHSTLGGWFGGHNKEISSLKFGSESEFIITGSADQTLRLWDMRRKREIFKYGIYGDKILTIDCDITGNFIASAGLERYIKIINIGTEKLEKSLKTNHAVTSVCFSPDGKILASGGFARQINLWDWRHKTLITSFHAHDDIITACLFSSDGKQLITASYDRTIKIWDLETYQCLDTLKPYPHEIYSLALSQDNKTIIAGMKDGAIAIIDKIRE